MYNLSLKEKVIRKIERAVADWKAAKNNYSLSSVKSNRLCKLARNRYFKHLQKLIQCNMKNDTNSQHIGNKLIHPTF